MGKERVIEVWSQEGEIIENMPRTRQGSIKAWVNIMYGCDEFCTYCIVPYTRGKERSRLPEDIIAEIQHLAAEGYQEVTLLGQNVNAYGKDFKDREYTFGDLLNDLNKIDVPRIRFTTSHPRDFDEKTIAALAKRGNLVEHIHLPVQSGNNEVLKRMNRKYTREMYLQLVRDLKAAIPGVSITTDIIVGFPGETEEQFQDTLSLVEEVGYEGAFTFIFSPREGTPAARMEDNVSEADKKDRLNRLNEAINRGFRAGNKRFEGQIVDVLVEGTSKNDDTMLAGYTRHNKLVNFKGDASKIGQIVNVKITEAKTWHLAGEMVNDDTTTNLPSFEKLKEKLATDPIMERYRQLTQKVHQNEKLLALYDEYIKKQKELIKFEHYGKLNAKLQKEAEMKALEDELYDNPLFNEYIQTQIELNELFSTMTHIIQYKVNKHLSE